MIRFARWIAFLVIAVSFVVILYGGYALLLTRQMTQAMAVSSKNPVSFTRVKPFLDGFVIDKIQLGHTTLSSVYFEGYPWQILNNDIQYIYIKQATTRSEHLFKKSMIWPFAHHVPLSIEDMILTFSTLGKEVTLRGEVKQAPNTPLLFKLTSLSPELSLSGQGEMRVQDNVIQSIDVEFHDAQLDFDTLETKRSSGWLSMTFDENNWNIVGETESGFVKIPQQSLFDVVVKLNGTTKRIDFIATGNDQDTHKAWVWERNQDQTHIRYLDVTKTIAWQGFNNGFLNQAGSLMTVFKPEIAEKEQIKQAEQKKKELAAAEKLAQQAKEKEAAKKAKEKAREKNQEKDKKEAEETKIAEAATDGKEEAETAEVKPEEVPLVYARIHQLLGNSVFQGFLYNRVLVVMPRICVDANQTDCWIARAQGGVLSYDTTDPWKVPSYFSRLKNYHESQQLRALLASLPIAYLTLHGDQNGVREMIIHGKDAETRRNIHIELSVLGLSAD